jgi:DNA-binding response OmpR family regulator
VSNLPGATVLVIDDDEAVVRTFAHMLRLEGFRVRTAPDAQAGLREATACDPDVIIVDLRMPLLDGLGFLQALRTAPHQRHTPVAIVTGDYQLEDAVASELRNLGAEVRFKPLWLDDLVTLTRSMLRDS